jgi:hypothetical protein
MNNYRFLRGPAFLTHLIDISEVQSLMSATVELPDQNVGAVV